MYSIVLLQTNWSERRQQLDRLTADLAKSWKYLRAIARQESSDTASMEKKMKAAQSLTDAAERLRVLETIQKRVQNRFRKLLLYMGLNYSQAEQQKVKCTIRAHHIFYYSVYCRLMHSLN